jgi:hypothetical protein
MPDSGNKVESAIALQAGPAIGAESATAAGLGIIVVELGITAVELEITAVELGITAVELGITAVERGITAVERGTEEATAQALGRATGARIVEEAGATASETEVYLREQTAVPGEVPSADREAAPAAHVRAVREVRRAWAAEAAVAGEGGNP